MEDRALQSNQEQVAVPRRPTNGPRFSNQGSRAGLSSTIYNRPPPVEHGNVYCFLITPNACKNL